MAEIVANLLVGMDQIPISEAGSRKEVAVVDVPSEKVLRWKKRILLLPPRPILAAGCLVEVAYGSVVAINADRISTGLLGAAIRRLLLDDHNLGDYLNESTMNLFAPRVFQEFLLQPSGYSRMKHLCKLARLSRREVRGKLDKLGFNRAEFLWTFLRVQAWKWLETAGVPPFSFERWLLSSDRSTFRRACSRAGLSAPWLTESRSARD